LVALDILSWQFALFACVTAVIYHLLPWSWKHVWLLVASCGFYAFLDIRYPVVLLILAVANYYLSALSVKKNSGFYSNAALLINVLSFGLLKWLTSPYSTTLGFETGKWILPVGFSFYLLQLISYQINIRSKKIPVVPYFIDFALYTTYFPKLLSGPIEKPVTFLQKLNNPLIVNNDVLRKALGLIVNGLFRKVIIANLLKVLVPPIVAIGVIPTWISVFAFAIQLYNDFLGYTSIVRGISIFFGLELSRNFEQPYLARNFSEFWSGWHISLTTWLRETIFFPLSRKLARSTTAAGVFISFIVPTIVTMLVSGFWHGATMAMVVWGISHGILLVGERLLYEKFPKSRPQQLSKINQFFSRCITFFFVCITWVFFSSPGLNQSLRTLKELSFSPVIIGDISPILPLVLIVLSFLLDFAEHKYKDEIWWLNLSLPVRSFIIAIALLLLSAALTYQIQDPVKVFIYQGF
jgi:alginate O-acetyltransferase complex protein AlgI